MKKYVKPELFYEHYELSQHIADCAWELNSAQETCYAQADPDYLPGFDNLFMAEANGCQIVPGKNFEMYCYHGGAQGINVFKS